MQNDEPNSGAAEAATVDDAQVYQCERATNLETFYHELGDDLAKKRLPFLNDLLRQLLTISVSLAGGGLYFLDDRMCDKYLKLAAVAAFFVAASLALCGILPYRNHFCANNPDEVKEFVERAVAWKDALVLLAGCCLFFGFVLAFLGVFLK